MGLISEKNSSVEKMEIISRIKEISFDLERTSPGTGEYQKALIDIVGRINTWAEGNNIESEEQLKVIRREILWLLNDMKTGKERNDGAILDMRKHVLDTLVSWNEVVGNTKAKAGKEKIRM